MRTVINLGSEVQMKARTDITPRKIHLHSHFVFFFRIGQRTSGILAKGNLQQHPRLFTGADGGDVYLPLGEPSPPMGSGVLNEAKFMRVLQTDGRGNMTKR